MTETEKKALALLNEFSDYEVPDLDEAQYSTAIQALCRAIERNEAFRQEVSDAVESLCNTVLMSHGHREMREMLSRRFIIPKLDPLVEAMRDACATKHTPGELTKHFRTALAARGGRIVWEGEDA